MRQALVLAVGLTLCPPAFGQLTVGPNDVYIRVVDVGPGLCTVTETPDGHYMVYDAGHWNGKRCLEAVEEIVDGNTIDLLILSHSDSDHLGDAAKILRNYAVGQIWRTGFERDTTTWKRMNKRIGNEVRYDSATVINLQTVGLVPGTEIELGDATVTLIAGWPKWTGSGPTSSEKRNAVSIVAQLEYQGRTVLFTGDTVGRRKDDPDSACKDAEEVMVARHDAGTASLDSDVMIAPHHGGNNGSSSCFIERVSPTHVVFSSGHEYQHPTEGAANRYLAAGVTQANIFRTDLGDDESDEGPFEWDAGRIPGCKDERGDDDVEIVLRETGAVEVAYRSASSGC